MLVTDRRLRLLIREVLLTEVSDEYLSVPAGERYKNLVGNPSTAPAASGPPDPLAQLNPDF